MVIIINSSQIKLQLRKSILNKRSALKKSFVKQQSQTIRGELLAELKKLAPTNVLVYLSFDNEVETFGLVSGIMDNQINVFVPRYFEDTGDWRLVKLENLDDLEKGPFGIPQPKSSEAVTSDSVDVAIIPGVAFDKKGVRLGYGKGIFDKLLAKSTAFKIGAAYDFQIVEKLPREKHDLVMDLVVTEKRVYSFRHPGVATTT